MALSPAFLDELRARTPLAALVGRRVKLSRSGRHWKGCCPFHGEKTPSFYVYEDGYHCFGCGAHGDAISFVMQTQGSAFMEAVGSLAAEAGLEVPKPSPEAAQAERRRLDLHEVLEAACTAFRRRLRQPEGEAALAYLRSRGLADETLDGFGLGWSGEGRGALVSELGRQNITPSLMLEAGLLREAEGGAPRELFFNRVTFPIRDRTGRIVSFGGRILGDGQPKYLNGPETAVFSKRRTLYGLERAREAVRAGAAVLAVEGYMDVIALHAAGFGAAVAPLGTALTAEQLEAMWRLSPSPVLCFDGDPAGARAAARAAEVALPLLGPERTLRIATLPSGEDPDTLVRKGGRAAFDRVLAEGLSLPDALFALLRDQTGDGSVESRARLSSLLEDKASLIADRTLSWEYRQFFRRRFSEMFHRRIGGRDGQGRGGARAGQARAARPLGTAAPRQAFAGAPVAAEQQRTLAAIVLRHPGLVHDIEEAWCSLPLPEEAGRLRHAVLGWVEQVGVQHHPEQLDSAALLAHLSASGLSGEALRVLAPAPVPLPACAGPEAMPAEAEAGWWHFYGLMHRDGLEREVLAAQQAAAGNLDADHQRRLIALRTAQDKLNRGEHGDQDLD